MPPDNLLELRDRRERVIARVTEGYAADLYDVDELERRLDAAHGARTLTELDVLVADLAGVSDGATTALVAVAPAALAISDPARPERKRQHVIMSSVERRGRWTVPSYLELRCFWGHAELDFREASIGPGVTTLDIRVTMANLELIVPPWLAVDVDVSSLMANVEERHRVPPEADPARPVLRIVGAVRLGNLQISTRLPRETGKRAKRERKQLAAPAPD